ncbi:type III polyketide synthase [Bacillus sp. FJAT-49711]|uniref:type III polyketide synthase n=1 Tax=Bacillus sp. FJAT-49711 TaxID=2833585 RepID=UPI001BCA365F|nr:3-oxoacyl-[acyl-carrier-protein] synthase III C-terminal domain-containing protein [Bacillus sp. FJAT-49711]MBS4217356.1 type III polyketide synthase [Bacillus sp. FJAT-49711]
MPRIVSVGTGVPEHAISQVETMEFAKQLFSGSVKDIERILNVFHNGEIEKRHFVKPLEWYRQNHSFSNKNDEFIHLAISLSIESIKNCLESSNLLRQISYEEIDAIIMINTTGMATPSLDARIMNKLPFSQNTKRIPVWGLGCAGGAAGLTRAYEYCRAFPDAKVIVVAVELCSLTFQKHDLSKSNIIGTSLFADGAAAALVVGDEVNRHEILANRIPAIIDTQSTLMKDSLDIMGWNIRDNGLYVVFSKDIPSIVKEWLKPEVEQLLIHNQLTISDISHFIAHPGGKKVLKAYEKALGFAPEKTALSLDILRKYGNMSSATVLFVLERFLQQEINHGDYGIIAALGPGFSSELLLVRWE